MFAGLPLLAASAYSQDVELGPMDAPILLGGTTYTAASFLVHASPPLGVDPDALRPKGLDARVAGNARSCGRISDFFLAGGVVVGLASPAMVEGVMGGGTQGAETGFVLGAEALTLNWAVNDVVKKAVRRPRPYTWERDGVQPTIRDADDQQSFYSGHTSTTAAWTFALADTMAHTEGLPPYVPGLSFGGAALLTGTMGALRVHAAAHYPSDVIVGGLMGAAFGVGVVEAHRAGVDASALQGQATATRVWRIGGAF